MKTKLKSIDKYITSNYPHSGIFLNTDDTKTVECILVSSRAVIAYSVGMGELASVIYDDLMNSNLVNEIEVEKEVVTGRSVSEDFALKSLALALDRKSIPK